jgi:DNA polymerase-3 subunit beta
MRLTVTSPALSAGLTWVQRSLPARPPLPVLAGIKVEVAGGQLRLSTFDYESSSVAEVETTDVIEDGAAIVQGKKFIDVVKVLRDGEVDLFIDGTRLRIVSGASRFSVPLLPLEDYPSLPPLPATVGSIDSDVFAHAVKQVNVAAGRDDTIPMLTGIYMSTDPDAGIVTLAATDRYRLAVKKIPYTPVPGAVPTETLIPARTLSDYAKGIGGSGQVQIGGTKDAGTFSLIADGKTATRSLLEAEFVKFAALLPTEFETTAVVDRRRLLDGVKRVAVVAEASTPCRIAFDEEEARIEAVTHASEDGEGSDNVDGLTLDGDPMKVGFNFTYLADGLNTIEGDEVQVGLVHPLKPVMLQAITSDDSAPDFLYMIMPLRVKDAA